MSLIELVLIAFNLVLVASIFEFAPRLRKRNLYFGVTTGAGFRETPEGRSIASRYRLALWAGTALALLAAWLSYESGDRLAAMLSPVFQMLVAMSAWIFAWRATRPHAAAPLGERSAELFAPADSLPGGILLLTLPLLGPLISAAWLALAWDDLPVRYPAHYGFSGRADRWVEKSAAAVFFNPAMAMLTLTLILVVALMIRYGTRRGTSGERAGWAARYRTLNVGMLAALMWLISVFTSTLALGPLLEPGVLMWGLRLAPAAILAAVIGFAIPLIRMSMEPTGGSDATPDECWKLGLFYVNPDDPALVVEKRDGPGYTINFGNRVSWLVIALLCLIAFAPVFFSRLARGA